MSIDDKKFKDILNSCRGTPYFFPLEFAKWEGESFVLTDKNEAQSQITGVRLQEQPLQKTLPFITKGNITLYMRLLSWIYYIRYYSQRLKYKIFQIHTEHVYTQDDLTKLIETIITFRKSPEFKNLVLSNRFLRTKQQANDLAKRVRFGLFNSSQITFENSISASEECYKQIVKAIKKSGFTIVKPQEKFDSQKGLEELKTWVGQVQLKRKLGWRLYLLFLGLLLFLSWCSFLKPNPPIIITQCDEKQFAGSDTPETHEIDLGKSSGSFEFQYETYSVKDQMIIKYKEKILFDSGCVGTNGLRIQPVNYSGWWSKKVIVEVYPNCDNTTGTQWNFTVKCPK